MTSIDSIAYRSGLRKIHPCKKAGFAVISLLITAGFQNIFLGAFLFTAMGLITVLLGKVPPARYLRMFRAPLLFLILGVGAVFIQYSGEPMSFYAVSFGKGYLTCSRERFQMGIRLFVNAMAAVSCLYFLALSTPMPDLIYVMKKIHIPGLLIELMVLIYRFLFVLWETAEALFTSSQSRLGGRGGLKMRIQVSGQIFAAVFIQAMKRSSYLYDAMESRCYDGEFHILSPWEKKEGADLEG